MGKKGGVKLFFIFLIFAIPFVFADSSTFLEIPNSAPYLIGQIPNVSWAGGTLENIFNLNNYFGDYENDTLIFYYEFLNDSGKVTASIFNGSVSFNSLPGFIGNQTILFYASDRNLNTSSNEVYLNVGVDTEAPKWFNHSIDKSKVYQNDVVTFITSWKDNFALDNYSFFINEGSGWIENSGYFSGKENASINSHQISAPAGKIILWKVCANDTSKNSNCTSEFKFSVFSRPINNNTKSNSGGTDSSSGVIQNIIKKINNSFSEDKEDFNIDVESFLVNLKQGTSKSRVFEITNTGTKPLNFSLAIDGLEEFAILSDSNFSLNPGESKIVTIDFRVKLDTEPGQYFGNLEIFSVKEVIIPLVLDVNAVNLDFEINVKVLPNSKNVKPGKEVFANISVKNNGDEVITDVVLEYAIKDFEGNIYEINQENLTIEKEKNFERNLTVPKNIPLGQYLFYSQISNEKDSAIYSDNFVVGIKFKFQAFLKSSLVFILIAFFSVISVCLLIKFKRQGERERALNLYVKLNELKGLIKDKKYTEAADLFISIKRIYGEPVSSEVLENKDKLIKEIELLSSKINFDEEIVDKTEVENVDNTNKEVKKEGEEKDSVEKK